MTDEPASLPIESIKRLDVHPGDILVVTPSLRFTQAEMEVVNSRLTTLLPEGVRIVWADGVEFGVIRAEEADREH